MKHFLLAIALLAGTMSVAEERKLFVGVEFGKTEGSYSYGSTEWDGNDQNSWGIKIGGVGQNDRIYVTYLDVNKYKDSSYNSSEKYKALFANFEAMTSPYKIVEGVEPQLFVGGHFGMAKVDVTLGSLSEDDQDFIYGVQAGVLFNVVNNFSIVS